MPGQHAVLSPSSATRWISCPASVRVIEKLPRDNTSSVYAEEGTKAHALGELKAGLAFGLITQRQFTARRKRWDTMAPQDMSEEQLLDMERHTDDYVDLIRERAAIYPLSQVMLEQRMDSGVPSSWGTSDTVIVSPEHVEIIDLKYGAGVPVSAVDNPQLRLYGLGALDTFGDVLGETKIVRMTIFQPRLDSTSTEELTADDLRAWRASIIPIANEALGPNARFGPSEKACRWCPAAGDCRARVERMTAIDFGKKPDLISPEELAQLVAMLPEVKQWAAAVEETALRKAYSEGVDLPGWKVVLSGGTRKIVDPTAALEKFREAGYDPEELVKPQDLKGLGDLEKIVKAEARAKGIKPVPTLESILGELIQKGQGRPSLAPSEDGRQSVDPNTEATKEFTP